MAAEIIPISTQDYFLQNYNPQETNLIPSFEVNTVLGENSYIEYYVYDNNKNITYSNYNFSQYTVLANGQSAGSNNEVSQIIVDPEQALITTGFTEGEYVTYFNFLNKKIGSNLEKLYISEISSDRTELRLDSTVLTEFDIVDQTTNFVVERENSPYFLDFYLNFGDNQLVIANNIILDDQDPNNPTVLVKLYEALPEDFDLNSTLWIVTLVEEPIAYQVSFPITPITVIDTLPLSGPNFNLEIKDQINNSTVSLDYTTLTSTALTSSQNQLKSLLEEKGLDINIDYTDFRNYVHFSSAQVRLENFYYKIQLIEEYTNNINLLNNTTNSPTYVSSSAAVYESKISDIITYFDDYEYFLYYENSPYAWPKTNNQKPYTLATSDSNEVLTWIGSTNTSSPYYGGLLLSASLYDNDNKDYLLYTIPEYLRDDPQNQPYETFVQMVAQLYDSIWVYYKDIISKYNNDNRLEYGVSKDIVADAIRDFGIKLYQNNFSNDDLYTAFLGLTPQGGLFPFPNITGSLPTPSGFEYVNTLISASNDYMPLDDVNKSLYKRIYHNLPYLLKAKGTIPGLRALITSYGIPDTVLRINEYGGKDKSNSNDWDYWQNTFNYAYYNTGSNVIATNWLLNPSWNSANNVPATLEFRFKVPNLSTISGSSGINLWNTNTNARIRLRYTGSGLTTGSYSGSIVDPYYQYAFLDFSPDFSSNPSLSASVYLPFANEGWWSVMATRRGTNFTLHVGNNVYEGGENGTQLGFYATSSTTVSSTAWTSGNASRFTQFGGEMYFQEIRYYNTVLSESVFKDYIMNPSSTEGNSLNSSPNQLVFRLPLGGELYTGSLSVHPKITGSWATTSSFATNSSASFTFTPTFVPNTEYFFYDQPVVGIKNAISDKIRVENSIIPTGSVLSPFRSLAQNLAISQSYTANTNLLEVAFSPQDEINQDIMNQIGYFNIGELIGDPRLRSSSATSYPDLDALRNEYFEKYTSNYDLNDYIRLIKFFDNSLFKMIKDFVPARTSLASGVVIKQTLLERNKYPQPQTTIDSTIAYYGSGSQNNLPFVFQNIEVSGTVAPQWNDYNSGTIENFSGGTGGTFEPFNGINTSPYGPNGTGPENIFGITQSWYETAITPSGSVLVFHDSQDEFYDGEFSGSVLTVTTQSLAQPYNVENISVNYKHVYYYGISKPQNDIFENNFLAPQTSPSPGEILFFNYKEKGFFTNPTLNAYNTTFIKIAKEDCNGNDNSLPLGQITKLYVYNPNQALVYPSNYSLQFDEYNVVVINEHPDYYLYETFRNWDILSAIGPIVGDHDNQVFDYTISSSVTASYSVGNGSPKTIINWGSTLAGTNLPHYNTPYFNTSSGILTFENTPNVPLIFSASLTSSGTFGTGSSFPIYLIQNRNNVENIIAQQNYSTLGTTNILLTASLYPIQNDQYYISLTKPASGGSISITKADLYLYQNWNNFTLDTFYGPSTSSCASTILEPYITTPNYYNSDYNPLINNAEDERLSSKYQDVDYSTGIATPTNFDLLISGSALKAAVQDSNYTSKRVTLPRYEGSKSTSQLLNTWSSPNTIPGYQDEGTYGKIPTVESLKTAVAYCDWIGGWPPERENASAIHVQYLIKSDGTVVVPNTSENSLADIKGNFESGENLFITSKTISAGQPQQTRKVIRGGTRIEPILTNQSGSMPGGIFLNSITLTDNNVTGNVVNDYQARLGAASWTFNQLNVGTAYADILFNRVITSGSAASLTSPSGYLRYEGTTGLIDEGVALQLSASLEVTDTDQNGNGLVMFAIVRRRSGVTTVLKSLPKEVRIEEPYQHIDLNTNVSFSDIQNGDEFYVRGYANKSNIYVEYDSSFIINQTPIANDTILISNLWRSGSGTTTSQIQAATSGAFGDYILFTTSSALINYYGNPTVYQQNIANSGFNPIVSPWSIQYGDEFRFEGREDRVYQIKQAAIVNGAGLTNPLLAVELNQPVPISGSVNFDQFLIRRYVDDASQILMEGFAPIDSQGPYIVRPEYVVPELNKSVDQFILDLTQKGLIT